MEVITMNQRDRPGDLTVEVITMNQRHKTWRSDSASDNYEPERQDLEI